MTSVFVASQSSCFSPCLRGYDWLVGNCGKQASFSVLFLQVKHSRETLITHPLVVFLLDRKWSMYGRKLFYVKLFIFLVFLLFLTGYVVIATPSQGGVIVDGEVVNCTVAEDTGSVAFEFFVESGRYILLILACVHIIFEVSQISSKLSSRLNGTCGIQLANSRANFLYIT